MYIFFLSEVLHPYGSVILVPFKKFLFQFPLNFLGDIFCNFLMSEFVGFKNIYKSIYTKNLQHSANSKGGGVKAYKYLPLPLSLLVFPASSSFLATCPWQSIRLINTRPHIPLLTCSVLEEEGRWGECSTNVVQPLPSPLLSSTVQMSYLEA